MDRIDELVAELAMLDKPCRVDYDTEYFRYDCMEMWKTIPGCVVALLGDPRKDWSMHSQRCQAASRYQRRGFVFDLDEYWRDYFAWQVKARTTGMEYDEWVVSGRPGLENYSSYHAAGAAARVAGESPREVAE